MPPDPLFDRLARALAGRYTVVRELGRGGMATVYLGTDLKLNRAVAIKVLPPVTRSYLGSGRFQQEVLLAAQLSHPHIVPLFEADEVDGILFYVMGYVEGESLHDRLRREGPLPLEEALRIAAEVGDALQYAHEVGIVHRDIKPANILLSRGHAMVADFGIAKLMEQAGGAQASLTGTGITVGTAEYMSPEQAGGEKRIDARSDVYSLAAVLYEMLAGEPPFTGPTLQAIVARVLTEPPRPLGTIRPGLPLHMERAIAAALAKLPGDRPASARELIALLTTHPEGAPRSRRVRVSLGLAAAAVAVALATWVIRSATPPARRAPAGMIFVPAGVYPVGGKPWGGRTATTVRLDSFYIDSTEVTVAAYQRYLAGRGAVRPWSTEPPAAWPVTGVLWAEAEAYCRWRDPGGGRLPTEDEWEAAARGADARVYPWGNSWEAGRANAALATDTLLPVGSLPLGRSWVGAVDLVGNAWEWVATDSVLAHGDTVHVIKGGAFDTPARNAAAPYRAWLPEDRRALWKTGFRCARSQ
jgi:formylglycine-generating enzyme required for sulfatase activity